MSEKSFQRSIEERAKQLTEKMIQLNDEAIADLNRRKRFASKEVS